MRSRNQRRIDMIGKGMLRPYLGHFAIQPANLRPPPTDHDHVGVENIDDHRHRTSHALQPDLERCPGQTLTGFGTFDEMFELLTLIQTGKMKPMPILLFGKDFWTRVVDFEALAEEGTINHADLDLFRWCESAEDAWEHIADFYDLKR